MSGDIFRGKSLMITGGTGSFGNAVLRHILNTEIEEIRIFSRDEKKQDDMRKQYKDNRIKFYIGDVRDPGGLQNAMHGVNYVFHAAALKQVPSCEFFPLEAVKTNVLGTDNMLGAAIGAGVEKAVCLSTDKAAYPINAMGISKAMMEKTALARARTVKTPVICCTRYGNVMCSRGSVIPLFIQQIKAGAPITITNPSMTRFLMSLEEAVELVLYAFAHGRPGDLFVQKAPACTIADLARAVQELFGGSQPIRTIGTRHGEKLFETLVTTEELVKAEELDRYYRIPLDKRDLNYEQYMETGSPELEAVEPYTSHNTRLLTVDQIKEKLLTLAYVKNELAGWGI